jgi:hypothetical protein
VIALCVGSFIFIELFKSRLWAMARPFRLLYLLKWFGLIFVAGGVSRRLDTSLSIHSFIKPVSLLTSAFQPVLMGVIHGGCHLKEKVVIRRLQDRVMNVLFLLGILVAVSFAFIAGFSYMLAFIFVTMVMILLRYSKGWLIRGIQGFLVLLITIPSLFYLNENLSLAAGFRLPRALSPEIQFKDIHTAEADVARFARHNTPENSVFLTPPLFGKFRLIGKRATVVDWKSFPFQDLGMIGWKQRVDDCYGPVIRLGHPARQEMTGNYKEVSSARLLWLKERYNCHFAVLYLETRTDLPVIFENQTYRVVKIETR